MATKKTVDIHILVIPRNGDRKIMQSTRITSGPSTRIRKVNKFSQFRGITTKAIHLEKSETRYIPKMNQIFKASGKCRTNIPT